MKKFVNLSLVSALVAVCATNASAERLSRQQLLAQRQKAKQEAAKSELHANQDGVPERKHPSQSSILDSSIILSFGRQWTFIPKGSLLLVPENYESRIGAEQTGKYVPFATFLRANRSWLNTYNVSLEQARGQEPINEKVVEGLATAGRVVITVFKGGPITTRAYKNAETTAQAETSPNR